MKTSHRFLFAPLSLAAALLGVATSAGATCIEPLSDVGVVGQAAAPALRLPTGWNTFARVKDVDVKDARAFSGFWQFTMVDSLGNLMDFGYRTVNESGRGSGTEFTLSFGHPPIGGNTCIGVWRKTMVAGHYEGSHYAPMYAADHVTFVGTVHRIDEITLSADGQSVSGTFVSTGYDVDGNVLFTRTGESSATRVKVATPFP